MIADICHRSETSVVCEAVSLQNKLYCLISIHSNEFTHTHTITQSRIMPLFGGQKKAGNHSHKKSSSSATNNKPNNEHSHHMKASNGTTSATPTLPPPSQPSTEHRHWTHQVPPPAPPTSTIPSRHELVFHTQLAHGSATKEVKDFSNVKELYAKIAVAFDIPTTDVCYRCNACDIVVQCLCVCLYVLLVPVH